jgi:methylglutaconyl-CoA hydratase
MSTEPVLTEIDERGVAALILNRPDVHNAFDDDLIARLADALSRLADDDAVRVVKLMARGKSFSAGADLNWMRRVADYSFDQNLEDATRLAHMLQGLARLPKPTVGVVQGAAFGGGVGLVACCDIVVASTKARFSLSEVKLGLIPATISPFVMEAVGPRQARRLFVSAERFDAETALRFGLVHEMCEPEALEERAESFVSMLLENGPRSMAAAKELVAAIAGRPIDDTLLADVAERIARQRSSDEGREGVLAFLEKRSPRWKSD